MALKKVLIISYYWPPSGGAGVQRWVKLAKYLKKNGDLLPYIVTVDQSVASYMQWDESLMPDASYQQEVYRTDSFEPLNYYQKWMGKKSIPTSGFSNVDTEKFSQKMVSALRSHLFIPDPRKGWNKYALAEAKRLIVEEQIDTVITTSPPHSSQLIGLKLKKELGIKWVADMRDPWTDIYYYSHFRHSSWSAARDRKLEKKVLLGADAIITVSNSIKDIFAAKDPQIKKEKIHVLPNGYDPEDFEGLNKQPNERFTIVYTGTMAETYDPEMFLTVLAEFNEMVGAGKWQLKMVGQVSEGIQKSIASKALPVQYTATVPHAQVNAIQKNADVLMLVIPNVANANGILTGKIFEYIATGNPIACLGPEEGDAAQILKACELGGTFERNNAKGLRQFILNRYKSFDSKEDNQVNWKAVTEFSREKQAKKVYAILETLE